MKPLALLAPALPSVSMTFVHREVDAMRRLGHEVQAHSLRVGNDDSEEGRRHAALTEVLYGDARALVRDAAIQCVTAPIGSLRAAGLAAWDLATGTFDRPGQRVRIPVQLVAGLALARRIRKGGASHLRVHFAHAAATVGMYAARAAGVPFSIVGHARDLLVEGGLLARKMKRATLFTTISRANKTELQSRYGSAARGVEIERCGVDRTVFRPRDVEERDATPTIATVGRLVPKKGIDLLLRAFADTHSFVGTARLVVIGDGPERERLEALRSELGLDENVEFRGAQDGPAVRSLLERSTLFCLPCRSDSEGDRDGIPVAFMEAMATRVAVIGGRVPGVDELIEDGVNGALVDAENTGDLGWAMTRLLLEDATRARYATRGADTVARDFDITRNAERVLARIEAADGELRTGLQVA